MNTLQLSAGGFDEMTFDEMQETDGGNPIKDFIYGKVLEYVWDHRHDIAHYWNQGVHHTSDQANKSGGVIAAL